MQYICITISKNTFRFYGNQPPLVIKRSDFRQSCEMAFEKSVASYKQGKKYGEFSFHRRWVKTKQNKTHSELR